MLYNKVFITQDDIERAKTELLYHIACTKQKGEELICCVFDIKNERMVKKIFSECSKVLKKMKKDKKISLFLTADTFGGESVEREYLFNKHPEVKTDELLNSTESIYFLIRL